MHPERNGQDDFAIYGVGSKRVLQELKQEQGELYQRVISKAPLESRMLSGKRELSVNQASNLVHALLEVEAEANPESWSAFYYRYDSQKWPSPDISYRCSHPSGTQPAS